MNRTDWTTFVRKRISSMLCDYSQHSDTALLAFMRDISNAWEEVDIDVMIDPVCYLMKQGAVGLGMLAGDKERLYMVAEGLEQWIVKQ